MNYLYAISHNKITIININHFKLNRTKTHIHCLFKEFDYQDLLFN